MRSWDKDVVSKMLQGRKEGERIMRLTEDRKKNDI